MDILFAVASLASPILSVCQISSLSSLTTLCSGALCKSANFTYPVLPIQDLEFVTALNLAIRVIFGTSEQNWDFHRQCVLVYVFMF